MKKLVLMVLGAVSFSFGISYEECMADSSYNTCMASECKPLFAMGNSSKAKKLQSQCENECREKHYNRSVNICKKLK